MAEKRRNNDSAYKYLFSSPEVVHQLLTRFVDDEVIAGIAVEDIEPFDKSFVSDAFVDRESDVIYRVNTGGGEVYIYVLIEFQSTVDKRIPIRMLHYILGLYDQLYRRSRAGKLPAVFPILLYNGSAPWTVARKVEELIDPSIGARYIPRFEYYPIIEREIADETLERIRGVVAAVMYLEKRRDDRELQNAIDHVIELLEETNPEQLRMFGVWLNQMFRAAVSRQQIERIEGLREVRSMLSEVIDQIENRGRQEGRRVAALRMLRKGYEVEEVVEVTELGREEVLALAEQVEAERSD